MAEGATYDDVTRATRLKMENIPDLLFRYQSCKQENFDLLEQDHFWLSDPVDFNDPFDCALKGEIFASKNDEAFASSIAIELAKQPEFTDLINVEQIEKIKSSDTPYETLLGILKYNKEDAANLSREMFDMFRSRSEKVIGELSDKIRRTFKVCSLSEVSDSILMWSHYGRSHTGYCVAYSLKEPDVRTKILPRLLEPVIYQPALFDASAYFHRTASSPFFLNQAATIKSEEWAYEREWRIIFSGDVMKNENVCNAPKPSYILLGAKMKTEDKKKVTDICEKRGIPTIQMGVSRTGFKLIQEQNKGIA